ncbi:MAG: hypothetical protein JXA62_03700 [Candidatus Aminicenantes bacterium]|nr:hypothetical protein [Candidatus Aminicenantes bacterium]
MNTSFWLRLAARGSYLGEQRLKREFYRRSLANRTRREINHAQLHQLNFIWNHAVSRVPYYIELKRKLGLPDQFPDLKSFFHSVPPLIKAEIQTDPRRFVTLDRVPGKWLQTSGSTGQPLSVFRGSAVHRQIRLDSHFHRRQWGVEWHHPRLMLWGDDTYFFRSIIGRFRLLGKRLAGKLKNRYHINAYFLNEGSLERCYRLMAQGRVRMLYSYSQAAMRLAQFCRNRTPLKGLKLVVLSSEYIDAASMIELEEIFGCPVVREYGAIETGIIAADFPGSPLRIMEHRLVVETPPCKNGMCDILVTCLENPYYPLFRYRLEDLTSAPMMIPEHGAAHLVDILGRVNDLLMMPGGKWLHSAYVTQAIRAVVPAKRFQIVQEKPDHLHIRLETTRVITAAEKERIRFRLSCASSQKIRITIVENEAFENSPGGKHRFVIRHGGFHP